MRAPWSTRSRYRLADASYPRAGSVPAENFESSEKSGGFIRLSVVKRQTRIDDATPSSDRKGAANLQ